MKMILIALEDNDYQRLIAKKGKTTWRKYLMATVQQ